MSSGHSLKRTSTTLYANTGASIEAIKRHTKHKSTKVCESYIAESVGYKRIVANTITSALSDVGSSSAPGADKRSMESSIKHSSGYYPMESSIDHANSSSHTVNSEPTPNREEEKNEDSIDARKDVISPKEVDIDIEDSPFGDKENICLNETATQSSQVSTQTFMSHMQKHVGLYKCENITINFHPTFHQKK